MIRESQDATNQRQPRWYAFFTRPRHEKKVKDYLDKKGVECYLPLHRTLNQWKDRRRWVEAPLFSCYIFARIAYVDRYEVLTVPSLVRMITFQNRPTPVQDREIEMIQRVLESRASVEVLDGLAAGDRVEVKSGPLAGMQGRLTESRGHQVLGIHIDAIGKSVLVDLETNIVEKVI